MYILPLVRYVYRLYFWYLHQNAETEFVRVAKMKARFYSSDQSQEIFERVEDEAPVFKDIQENIEPDDVFYDIGAQYGVFSCLVGTELEQGKVIAFEPMVGPYHRLRYNLSLNDIDESTFQCALTEHSSSGTGWLDRSDANISLISGDRLREREEIPVPDVVKIDVEGGELKAVKGLERTLKESSCRLIYCEIHPKGCFDMDGYEHVGLTKSEISELREIIEGWGFTSETIHQRGDQTFIRAEQ